MSMYNKCNIIYNDIAYHVYILHIKYTVQMYLTSQGHDGDHDDDGIKYTCTHVLVYECMHILRLCDHRHTHMHS